MEELFDGRTVTISIIGLGLIGGSIARALKNSGADIRISAYDRPEVLGKALNDKVIDNSLADIRDALADEVIFLCLPIQDSLDAFAALSPYLSPESIITDVCGVKGIFEERWKSTSSQGQYIGGHPMTGKEKGGYENSDPLLFENAVYILTGTNAAPWAKDKMAYLTQLLGARVNYLEAGLHDRIVSAVSHLPQLLSIALVNSAAKSVPEDDPLNFAAGGFRDMTRIASSSFSIWKDVMKYNQREILRTLSVLGNEIDNIKNFVEEDKSSPLENMFLSASDRRASIPQSNKGFLSPLYDIFVYVKDEPGIISRISTALFAESINIKDIELLKIREGSGGTFRMSFESLSDMQKARTILNREGFTVG